MTPRLLTAVLLAACVDPADPGLDGTDALATDTGVKGHSDADPGRPTDVHTDLVDTDRPDPTGEVVCFPGGDGRGTTCVPVVEAGDWGPDWAYPTSSDSRYRAPTRFLDLVRLASDLRLAPHFRLDEWAQLYKGEFAVVQPHAVAHVQAVRDAVGGPVWINSGYRNPAYNASVGGATLSRHMWGDAVDIRADAVDLQGLGALCEGEDAGFVLLYTSHVHCDWRDDALDPVLFTGDAMVGRWHPAPLTARIVPGAVWTAPALGFDEGEPLRVWTARGPSGALLRQAVSPTFVPPAGATRVEVVVGGVIREVHAWP